jgi:hypothetical protein
VKRAALVLSAAVAFAAATWVAGWWAVVVLAMACGVLVRDLPAALVGVAAGLAWLGMILAADRSGSLDRLLDRLGGMLGVPGWFLPVLAAGFACLLGWSGAHLTGHLRRPEPSGEPPSPLLARERQDTDPAG